MIISKGCLCLLLMVNLTGANSLVFTPTFYELSLNFSKFSTLNKYFDGEATVYFNVTQNTFGIQEISFDVELIKIEDVNVFDQDNKEISIIKSWYKGYTYSLRIKLDDQVSELSVTIKYEGHVGNAGDTGVFISQTQDVIATNSYPLGVRKIFPCIIDPSLRTPFKLDVVLVNQTWGIHHLSDGAESPFLPVYAVGFIMTYYYRKVDDISTNRFSMWVPNNNIALYNHVNSNKLLKNILGDKSYFNNFFDDAHLDKIHIVLVRGIKMLSVVNHRLICISPDILMTSGNQTAEMSKATAVATINALSKHFFRCVISPNTWEDFWLADSVALYLQYALLDSNMLSNFNFPDLFMLELQRPAMRGSSMDVNPKTIDPSLLITPNIFPPAYQGAAIVKMLEPLSSKEGVLQDLLQFYKKFVYHGVDTKQFVNYLSHGSMFNTLNSYGKMLDPILDKWLHEVGYPYITNVMITNDGFTIAQETFYGSNNSSAHWIIPFVYKDASNQSGNLQWLNGQTSASFKKTNVGTWIQLNKESKGMFRVNYGDLINNLLQKDAYQTLTDVERGALVDDAYYLSRNNIKGANFGTVLSLFEKLENETNYTPFTIAMNHANIIWHLCFQVGLGEQFELKLAKIIESQYLSINWYKPKKINLENALWTRSVVESACAYSASTCQTDAQNHLNVQSTVLNDLLPTMLCYTIRNSPQMSWNMAFPTYYNPKDSQFVRADALFALACPKALGRHYNMNIEKFLDKINSDAVLVEDALRAFQYIYFRPENVKQTVNYINDNFYGLLSRFGDDLMAELITDISKLLLIDYYSTTFQMMKYYPEKNTKTYSAVVSAIDRMKESNTFLNNNLYHLLDWLDNNSTTYKPMPSSSTSATPASSNSSICSTIMTSTNILLLYVSFFITLLCINK